MKKLQFNSPVVLTFFFISLAALILGTITNGTTTTVLFSAYRASLTDPFTYVRFFGHVFGHASITHFFNNMLLLLVVGPPLEELYGSKTLISGILATAVISGMLQFILFPGSMLLGASGIVFMLIMLSHYPYTRCGDVPWPRVVLNFLYSG